MKPQRWQLQANLDTASLSLRQELGEAMPNLGRLRRLEKEVRRWERKLRQFDERSERRKRTQAPRSYRAPTRRTPMRPRDPVRAARAHEKRFSEKDGYGNYVRGQCCIRCGKPPPSQFAHILGVDLGGEAQHGLPLCAMCHGWQETHKLAFNAEFEERQGIPPLEMANAMRVAYQLEHGSAA